MIAYSEILQWGLASEPMQRISFAAEGFVKMLRIPALAVTYAPSTQISHDVFFARGYCEENLRHLRSEFIPKDPSYLELVARPSGLMTWRDTGFDRSYTAQRWLIPAGYNNGISLPIRSENQEELGSIHLNTFETDIAGEKVDAVIALADHLSIVLNQHRRIEAMHLTGREREVIACITEGKTNQEIATELYLSPKTVSTHVENILRKMGVRTRVDIAVTAVRLGI